MSRGLLNVSEVLLSPEFMQPVRVFRQREGFFEKGKFVQREEIYRFDMLVCAVSEKELEMIPEGDRIKDSKSFHCLKELFTTQDIEDGEARTSDMLEWKKNRYKIVSVNDNSDYGYYKAYGVKVRGY